MNQDCQRIIDAKVQKKSATSYKHEIEDADFPQSFPEINHFFLNHQIPNEHKTMMGTQIPIIIKGFTLILVHF